jgi:hypothetical protein
VAYRVDVLALEIGRNGRVVEFRHHSGVQAPEY